LVKIGVLTEQGRKRRIKRLALKESKEDRDSKKYSDKYNRLLSEYSDDFKEEMIAYFLVAEGVCTLDELYDSFTYHDVIKVTEILNLKSELESI
jgi:hypothetical protein